MTASHVQPALTAVVKATNFAQKPAVSGMPVNDSIVIAMDAASTGRLRANPPRPPTEPSQPGSASDTAWHAANAPTAATPYSTPYTTTGVMAPSATRPTRA